jgi:hypothetical protein
MFYVKSNMSCYWFYKACFVIALFCFVYPVSAADVRSLSSERLMIIPFSFDESPNAELVARQSAYILGRKLRAGRFILLDIDDDVHNEQRITWDNRFDMDSFFNERSLNWLVTGHVENITRDPDGHNPGNRFIGIAGIPIQAQITVSLFDCSNAVDVWEQTFRADINVPRLRVFGLNRSPFPSTVKTVDAFVHDAILKASRQIIAAIIRQKSGELHHE